MSVKQVQIAGWLKDINDNFGTLDRHAGRIYYCDNNAGSDTNDGSSWAKAFKTLAVALAASHANIAASASGWAARNTIYYKADAETVNLVKGAQKTDVIGVGSYDHRSKAGIVGNHVLDATSYMGCRFINIAFRSPAAGGVIMTVPTQQSGIEFIGCTFDGASTTAATTGILVTASESFAVRKCVFEGAFSTAAISVGAGASNRLIIEDNIIHSGAIGILVNSGATCAVVPGIIRNNVIRATTLVIDEDSDKFYVIGNRGATAANAGATTYDQNLRMSVDNIYISGDQNYAEAVPVIRWGAQS